MIGLQSSCQGAGRDFVVALDGAGVVDTLVAVLKWNSPYCVAAAAGALAAIGQTAGGGQALVDASPVVPALVRVLKTPLPPGDAEEGTGLCARCGMSV